MGFWTRISRWWSGRVEVVGGPPRDFVPRQGGFIEIDQEGVRVRTSADAFEAVRWADLIDVKIVTTSEGPFVEDTFWLLSAGTHGCAVPGAYGTGLLRRLGRLPGFNHQAVIDASSSTSDATFHCWSGKPGDALIAGEEPQR